MCCYSLTNPYTFMDSKLTFSLVDLSTHLGMVQVIAEVTRSPFRRLVAESELHNGKAHAVCS